MKTGLLIIIGIIGLVAVFSVILHTELLGENLTYGKCLITSSGNDGFSSSGGQSSEIQCKQSCAHAGNSDVNEKRNVSCKFQTFSGYGWVASSEEFEYMIDKLALNPLE